MEKFKKIDREFLLSDSSLNVYSYRLLTAGYQKEEYEKNPIGFKMHLRDDGVVLKWEGIRIDGDRILGKPVINLSHPNGQRVVDEVMNGFLNAASMGNIVALEISSDPKDYLPNQKGPTISKWYNRECSLVDIPGNYNAIAENLVDADFKPLNLADFKPENLYMEKIILTAAMIANIPNLKADATQAEAEIALQNLIAKAATADSLQTKLTAAEAAKATAETELQNLKTATTTQQVQDLIAGGLTAKKFTAATGEKLKAQYAGKPTELKDLIDSMPSYEGVVASLKQDGGDKLKNLVAKTWDELDKAGLLADLKAADENAFFDKYTDKYGNKHQEDKR